MPQIDVTDVLSDPDFCEMLTVIRRTHTMVKGRPQITPTTISPSPVGVVIAQADAPVLRGPEQQTLPKLVSVYTTFRLRGPSKDPATGLPVYGDIIVWGGDNFVVNKVQDFTRFGTGFVQADCSSQDIIDQAPGNGA